MQAGLRNFSTIAGGGSVPTGGAPPVGGQVPGEEGIVSGGDQLAMSQATS